MFASSVSKTFAANAHVKGTDCRLKWNRTISSAAVSTAAYDTVVVFSSLVAGASAPRARKLNSRAMFCSVQMHERLNYRPMFVSMG